MPDGKTRALREELDRTVTSQHPSYRGQCPLPPGSSAITARPSPLEGRAITLSHDSWKSERVKGSLWRRSDPRTRRVARRIGTVRTDQWSEYRQLVPANIALEYASRE